MDHVQTRRTPPARLHKIARKIAGTDHGKGAETLAEQVPVASGPPIAVIGVGRIGLPVVANLVRAGYQVRAHDTRVAVQPQVIAAGARWTGSAAAAVTGTDLLVTVLPGSPELGSLMLGDPDRPGLLDVMQPGSSWLDLTSAAPDLGATLARAASERGIGFLDSAIGGGVDAAERGDLTLYIGGDRVLLDRYRPLLTAIADPARIRHMGAAGSGYVTKLLVNLLWFGQAVATGEALLLGQRAGLDPALLQAVLADSAASSEFVRSALPALLNGDYLTTFGLDRCVEELDSTERLAGMYGSPFDLSALVAKTHRDALAHFGPVDGELMAVAYLEERAGVRLRKAAERPAR